MFTDYVQDHSYIATGASKNIRKPRYIGDISSPHLTTPKRAEECLDMTKKVIESKNKTIASLTRKLRYAQEKIETMKNQIIQLPGNQYIGETAFNELLVRNDE